jgi:hypothetical protein
VDRSNADLPRAATQTQARSAEKYDARAARLQHSQLSGWPQAQLRHAGAPFERPGDFCHLGDFTTFKRLQGQDELWHGGLLSTRDLLRLNLNIRIRGSARMSSAKSNGVQLRWFARSHQGLFH